MNMKFDLPILDSDDDYILYGLPDLALSEDLSVRCELEFWPGSQLNAEIVLTGDHSVDPDLRHFIGTDLEEKIKAHLLASGIATKSISPREPGAHAVDQVIYNAFVEKTPGHNHAYEFSFSITSDKEDASDVTPEMLRSALIEQLNRLTDADMMERCVIWDTTEEITTP